MWQPSCAHVCVVTQSIVLGTQLRIPSWKSQGHPPWMATDFPLHHFVVAKTWFYLICSSCVAERCCNNFLVYICNVIRLILARVAMDKRWCILSESVHVVCCCHMNDLCRSSVDVYTFTDTDCFPEQKPWSSSWSKLNRIDLELNSKHFCIAVLTWHYWPHFIGFLGIEVEIPRFPSAALICQINLERCFYFTVMSNNIRCSVGCFWLWESF